MTKFNPSGKRERGSQPIIEHSNQPLTFARKTSFGQGRLVPILCQPTLPGEYFEGNPEFLLRTHPFVSQVYQRYNVDIFYYYVPSYLLWNNFHLALSGGYSGTQDYVHPYFDWLFWASRIVHNGSLFDYFDISLPDANLASTHDLTLQHFYLSALPISAYFKVFFDHFASPHYEYADFIQEMIEKRNVDEFAHDGDCGQTLFGLMTLANLGTGSWSSFQNLTTPTSTVAQCPRIHYDWDYFTSAMPEQQHGPLMEIPLQLVNTDSTGTDTFKFVDAALDTGNASIYFNRTQNSSDITVFGVNGSSSTSNVVINGEVFENKALVSDLRSVELLTEFFESLGNVSFRPEDYLLSQFNQKSSDQRLNKSEMISYQRFLVNIGEVFSNNVTAGTEEYPSAVPGVGTSTAKGYGIGKKFSYKAPDYGYIIGLVAVHPEAAYGQGVPRHFRRLDRFDYENPKFAHLGYQEVFNYELALSGTDRDFRPFGYQPRYSDHRTNVNRVNGDFRLRNNVNTASRQFREGPVLNEQFLQVIPNYNNLNRVFNSIWDYQNTETVQFDLVQHLDAFEPLPAVGLPRV